uniref:Uncharacterized protein n=1 Tax=Rhizophora mucronata TaxID=61149 RepID=A0A2P2MXS2_RHIMU
MAHKFPRISFFQRWSILFKCIFHYGMIFWYG